MNTLLVNFARPIADCGPAFVPLEMLNVKGERLSLTAASVSESTPLETDESTVLLRTTLPSGDILTAQAEINTNPSNTVTIAPRVAAPDQRLTFANYLSGFSRVPKVVVEQMDIKEINLWVRQRGGVWLRLESVIQHFDFDIPSNELGILAVGELGLEYEQCWLQLLGSGFPPKTVALPPARSIRITIAPSYSQRHAIYAPSVIFDGTGPAFETLLRFYTRGDFESARLIAGKTLNNLEERWHAGTLSATSAVIAGYFSISSPMFYSDRGFLNVLASMRSWLPDANVINAWRVIKSDQPDWRVARWLLLRAAHTGVPLFTYGLRLLLDGLVLIQEQNEAQDRRVVAAIDYLLPYATVCDWTEATTSLHVSDPSGLGSSLAMTLPTTISPPFTGLTEDEYEELTHADLAIIHGFEIAH